MQVWLFQLVSASNIALPVVMDIQYERGPSPLDVKAATAIW